MFIVANTHILFNMKRGEIKAGQIALLLATIDKYVQELSKAENFAGTFLCGDFNIDPFSPLYHFIRDGILQFAQFPRDVLAFDTNAKRTSMHPRISFNVPLKVPLDPTKCQLLEVDRPNSKLNVC
jgi:endonuclease/exonuclease/phosphatase family metal-dependent hydrolase